MTTQLPESDVMDGSQQEGLRRFITLRWIAVAALGAALPILLVETPGAAFWTCNVAWGLLALSNIAHGTASQRIRSLRILLLLQFSSDLLILTILVGATGGIGHFCVLYTIHVVLAGLLLGRRDALAVSGLALGLLLLLAALQILDAPFPIRGAGIYTFLVGDAWVAARTPRYVALIVTVIVVLSSVLLLLIMPLVDAARVRQERLEAIRRELSEKTQTLGHILDGLGGAMMVLDSNHDIRWLNRQASQWFPGMQVGMTRRCYDPVVAPNDEDSPCPSCHVLATGERWQGDYTMPPAAGTRPSVFRIYASPLTTEDGERSVVELVLDVSAELEADRQILQGRKTAATAQFAAGFAHEMNTPLASLAAGLRVVGKRLRLGHDIARSGEHEHVLSILGDLTAQTERCQRITESLLGYSRQLRTRLEPVEIDAVVKDAFARLAEDRDLRGIEVFAEATDAEMPAVFCDPTQLQLVLTNLLTNAVDSIRSAGRVGAAGRIRVGVELSDADTVAIRIRDNGTGMPSEVAEHVLDPFFTTKPVGAGTGLGLSVAHGLISGMGGSLSFDTTPSVGTAVVLRLCAAAPGVGTLEPPREAAHDR